MTPSANAIFVIELNGDRILYWGSGQTATYTYNITANTWDTTTFAARSAAHAAGSINCPSFFIRPDAQKLSRNSYVYVFRGAAGAVWICSISLVLRPERGPPPSFTAGPV